MIRLRRSMNNNLTEVTLDGLVIWFSYETPVAFRVWDTGERVVSENIWSNTTGRHLSEIDGGSPAARRARVPREEFERRLEAAVASFNK